MRNKHSIIEILFKPLLIIFAVTGVVLQAKLDGGFFSTNVYLYFTILSNTLIAIVFFIFFCLEIIEQLTGKRIIPHWLLTIKYMFTSAMFLTLLVSVTLLMPFKDQAFCFQQKICVSIYSHRLLL